MMARLTEAPSVSAPWLRLALVAGPAVFLAAGVAGVGFAGGFFAFPVAFAKPIILFIEAFMLLSIAVSLPMLVAGPPGRRGCGMSAATLAGLLGAALVGLGLYGLIISSQPLRKILAFNLGGSGVFLHFRDHRPQRGGGGIPGRSCAAGDGDHRHCRRFCGERARRRLDASSLRGDRARHARSRRLGETTRRRGRRR